MDHDKLALTRIIFRRDDDKKFLKINFHEEGFGWQWVESEWEATLFDSIREVKDMRDTMLEHGHIVTDIQVVLSGVL